MAGSESRSHERLRLLEDVGEALDGATGAVEVMRTAVGGLVPRLADIALLVMAEPDGRPRLELCPPARTRVARDIAVEVADPLLRLAAENSGMFRWRPARAAEPADWWDPALARLLDGWGADSLLVSGQSSGDGAAGALLLVRTGAREPFVGEDVLTSHVIAREIGLALEAARLRGVTGDARRGESVGAAGRKWIHVFDLAGWAAAVVGKQGGRISAVNPAFASLHGFAAAAELTGRPFTDLLPPDRRDEPGRWTGAAARYESVHRRHDGRTFPVEVSVTALESRGPAESYVVTVQDLTDLRRAEERLRRAQRMEAVGRLAGGVAHEVNNMITIVLGFSDLLSRAPELPEILEPDVQEIRKAASRAGKITQQLLAFSRQQLFKPAELRLNSVIEELVPVLRLLLPANIRIETRLSPLEAIVRADRAQLEQVLINLAFNARDAMAGGGTICIATESRFLRADAGQRLIGVPFAAGQYALVSVVDTGHGMDEATLGQLFEPFFTTKPAGSGTGLGLATVYGIVKEGGGYVWAESAPGEGTTFTVGLPLIEGPRPLEASRGQPPAATAEHEGTVLIVEDEDGVRQLAARILGQQGYRVLEARNGTEGLRVLQRTRDGVDLVLTDVVVPDLGTEELARRVQQAQRDVPILYMSGYPREEVLQRGLIGPDQPFLQKPFTREELAEGVSRVLRGHTPVVGG